ncbi:MAG: GntR family transcriptional regulator [Gammaproteobacteria bacterium]|nr:GntR family transcriptional regulator [Gammaproteobacteria bacterium]
MTNSGPTRSLPDQIADALASDIVHGRLSGGQRLSEAAVAERFGVSRGPVRDALSYLERNMLVTIKPRSYTYVNRLTVWDFDQLFDFRKQLRGLTARYAARNRTEEEYQCLRAYIDQHERQLGENLETYIANVNHGVEMWQLVAECSHAGFITQQHLGHNTLAFAVQERITAEKVRYKEYNQIAIWKKMVGAIRRRNENKAFDHAAESVAVHWEVLREVFVTLFPEK